MKKNINNYCGNISNNINFKISTLITNSKINKTFGTLLKLCIKYDIQLFNNNDNNNSYYIRNNKEILNDVIILKNRTLNNYTNNISNIKNNDNLLVDMDNLYNDIRKSIKEIQTLYVLLNDIYNDVELKKMFYDSELIDNEKKSDENNEKKKFKISDKFIAEYIC